MQRSRGKGKKMPCDGRTVTVLDVPPPTELDNRLISAMEPLDQIPQQFLSD